MGKIRDLASMLGKTQANNPDNSALLDSGVLPVTVATNPILALSALDSLPNASLSAGDTAYVAANNRFYISNGSGWYNVALVNVTPSLTISPAGAITLSNAGTATVITLTGQDSDNSNLTFSVDSDGTFLGLGTIAQDSSVFTITPFSEDSATQTSSTLTFKVTDGVGIGSGTTTFSLTFGIDWGSVTYYRTEFGGPDGGYFTNESVHMTDSGTRCFAGGTGGNGVLNAYVWHDSNKTWTQEATITASNGAASDQFGQAVDANHDGTKLIIGAPGQTSNTGSAYYFTRSGSTYTQVQEIAASMSGSNTYFGSAVCMSRDGSRIGISAPNNYSQNYGSIHTYYLDGSTYSTSTSWTGASNNYYIGRHMEMDHTGDRIFATSHSTIGENYIRRWNGSAFVAEQTITNGNTKEITTNGDGSILAIGNSVTLEVNVYNRSGTTWSKADSIGSWEIHTAGEALYGFGYNVSLSDDGLLLYIGSQDATPGEVSYLLDRDSVGASFSAALKIDEQHRDSANGWSDGFSSFGHGAVAKNTKDAFGIGAWYAKGENALGTAGAVSSRGVLTLYHT